MGQTNTNFVKTYKFVEFKHLSWMHMGSLTHPGKCDAELIYLTSVNFKFFGGTLMITLIDDGQGYQDCRRNLCSIYNDVLLCLPSDDCMIGKMRLGFEKKDYETLVKLETRYRDNVNKLNESIILQKLKVGLEVLPRRMFE